MPRIEVALGDRSYFVHIENRAARHAARYLAPDYRPTRVLVISDENVAPLYADAVLESFKSASVPASLAVMPAGESEKNLQRVETLYHKMLAAGLDRRSLVVALGGGVVGDVAGFAAATYMRGIAVMQVPTTIVAQVDSSVGGKTGVDLPEGKNLVGAFHQPVAVVIDPGTLATLPEREVRAGLAEVIKHGVIRDAEYFALLEREGKNLIGTSGELAERIIHRSVEIKAQVVSEDERESGLRAILNFGHTIGHALEAVTGYTKYLHGEAVAIGMVAAADIAVCAGICAADVPLRIRRLLRAVGLPTEPERVTVGEILASAGRDKKAVGGKARFVLPRGIGTAGIIDDVAFEAITRGLLMTGFAG